MKLERKQTGKWYGFLVFVTGIIYLLADFSADFDVFGVSQITAIFLLVGLLLLSRQSPLKVHGAEDTQAQVV